ncbi:MAG: hypothetical protein LAT75_00920 [Candidatus Cyclonatronum sp.]|uniref:hypothetical protein n=1 Tax=Cyclonatronum sp. TaxID=3024185 RepID=UPI0025B9A6A1|nr:hypothetical protein [Cyclonatronum sp.]MCC5933284.1 hypothetical protein [Balneolales bacterium]MCH8485394.1 hypothetical protein [Cyclonatronum sp.]
MKQITLKVDENRFAFFLELVGSLDFVEIEDGSGDTKEEITANLSQAMKELKAYQKGELKGIPAQQLLDEI